MEGRNKHVVMWIIALEAYLKKKHDTLSQETQGTHGKYKILHDRCKKKRKFGWYSDQGTLHNDWGSMLKANGGLDKPMEDEPQDW